MGDRLTDEDEPQTESRSYGDIFDELFPHYLYMGMTPEQYWDGESGLKKAYRKAWKLRKKNEEIEADRHLWLQGLYFRDALNSMPLLVAGFIPKGAKPGQYPEKPRLEQYEDQQNEEKRKKQEEKQTQLAMAMMQARFLEFNRNFEKRKQAEEAKAEGT